MVELAEPAGRGAGTRRSPWGELLRTEDWWAIWIGLGLVATALALFGSGASVKWLAIAPQKMEFIQPQLARSCSNMRCST